MLTTQPSSDWITDASATRRAAGVAAVIEDYLRGALADDDRAQAERLLTRLLDDPSPLVRRALADGLAGHPAAPRHVLSALAADKPEIAAVVWGRAASFSASELAEAVSHGGARVHLALARRPGLPARAADALAEQADRVALVALAENQGADLGEAAMLRMLERASGDAALREALLARPRLPGSVRARLAEAVGAALSDFIARTGWLEGDRMTRALRESREAVVVRSAGEGARAAAIALARQLRASGQLTTGLLLRSLLTGDPLLFTAALADLTGRPLARVAAHVAAPEGSAFGALYAAAGVPVAAKPVFVAILRGLAAGSSAARLASLGLGACAAIPEADRGPILALLRKLESELARETARRHGA